MNEERFEIYEYKDFTTEMKKNFFTFCEDASYEALNPASVNMFDDDWENQPHTLPYILEKSDRFKEPNGSFHILTANGSIIACAGVYKSDFDSRVAILGCRTWVNESYRHRILLREYLLPVHKQWAIDNKCDVLVLTFNQYNKNLIKTFQRLRLGESNDRISSREDRHLFYTNMHVLDYPVTIKNTKQWVTYERLSDYDFDWESIRHIDN